MKAEECLGQKKRSSKKKKQLLELTPQMYKRYDSLKNPFLANKCF